MEKSSEAFRTISEVSTLLDIPAHVLRFWESRFSQIKPVKRGGGRRYYRPDDINLLRGIRGLLHSDGLTIKGAQKLIREKGVRHIIELGADDGQDGVEVVASALKKHQTAAPAKKAEISQPGLFEPPPPPEPPVPEPPPEPEPQDDHAVRGTGDQVDLAAIVSRLRTLRDSMRS